MASERDSEDQADMVLGALRGMASLVAAQPADFSVPSVEISDLLTLLVEEMAKVVPNAGRTPHGIASND